jgi:hypothetical protein
MLIKPLIRHMVASFTVKVTPSPGVFITTSNISE